MDRQRLGHIMRKEVKRIRRDPATLRLLIVAPLLQLVLFGYAATNDVRNVPVAVYDADRTPDSRLLADEIGHSYYFQLVPTPADSRALEQMLLRGRAQIAVYIPRDFSRAMARGESPVIGVYVDGTDSNTAGIATAYLAGLLRERGVRWQLQQARHEGTALLDAPSLVSEPRVWYNVELKSANYMVPGVFGLILLVITINLSSLAVVRERETGTLEQLMVTPLRRSELVLGKMAPLGLIAFMESGLIVLLALNWFHVPFRGSYILLFSCAAVFLIANLGLGQIISALSKTQQEAQILSFLLIMPSVLLSGFMFPIQNMPSEIQALTYFIPFRYFLEIVRGLFLRGVGLHVLWPQALCLVLWAIGLSAAGIGLLRKRL